METFDFTIDSFLSLTNKGNDSSKLTELASHIMNNYCINNGQFLYHPIEIEFYVYKKGEHEDILVYPRDKKEARDIFFHLSGMDICFKSSIKDGHFGGILIRALEREDGMQFGGPLICKDEVLNSAADEICIVQQCEKEFNYSISKVTQRKGFKGPKGIKDIFWNKQYRFVRDNIQKPIIRVEKLIDPNTGEIEETNKKCYL